MLFDFSNEYSHSTRSGVTTVFTLGMNFGLVHAPNPGTIEWAQHSSRSLGYVRGCLIQKQFRFLSRTIHNMQCVRRQPARTKSQESLYCAQMKTTARNNMRRLGRTMNKTIILCVIWECTFHTFLYIIDKHLAGNRGNCLALAYLECSVGSFSYCK